MAISRTLSHLTNPNRYWLQLSGIDNYGVAANATLDVTGSFTIGLLIQLINTPVSYPDYLILTKGHPSDAAQGSICFESVGNHLQVSLHDGAKTLVIKTNEPVLNSLKIMHLVITWDSANKALKIYKDKVEIGVSIVTGINNHSLMSDMGDINTNISNFVFGTGIGKNGFIGKIVHAFYASRAFSSSEVSNDYESVKYTGSYPSTGKIIFTSNRENSGRQDLYTMNGDFTDQELLFSHSSSRAKPLWSPNGLQILASGTGLSTPLVLDSDGGNPRVGGTNGINFIWESNTVILCGVATNTSNHFRYSVGSSAISSINSFSGVGTIGGDYCFNPADPHQFLSSSWNSTSVTTHVIQKVSFNPANHGIIASSTPLLSVANTANNYYSFFDPKYSLDGTKIGYSYRPPTGIYSGVQNVWIMNANAGLNTQCTFETIAGANNRFLCFSPDSSKVLISKYDNIESINQIWCYDFDSLTNTISNGVNISDNSFNEIYADWKA